MLSFCGAHKSNKMMKDKKGMPYQELSTEVLAENAKVINAKALKTLTLKQKKNNLAQELNNAIMNSSITEKEKSMKDIVIDFYVNPHPVNSDILTLAIFSYVPNEIAFALNGKTISLSKKKGSCLFPLDLLAEHNPHMSPFSSQEELDEFISRVKLDIQSLLSEAGYAISITAEENNIMHESAPANAQSKKSQEKEDPDLIKKFTEILDKQNGSKKFKIGDIVAHDAAKCQSSSKGKMGIVKVIDNASLGIDYGPSMQGHNLDRKLTTKTGQWENHPYGCLTLLHPAEENYKNYISDGIAMKNMSNGKKYKKIPDISSPDQTKA